MDSTSYTPSANQVLLLAQEQANYFKHQAIGTEHLLLALVLEENGVAGQVLRQNLVSSVDIKEEIERIAGYGTLRRQAPDSYLPYSPKSKAVLNDALRQAMMMGSSKIGTEHLLLALWRCRHSLIMTETGKFSITISHLAMGNWFRHHLLR